MIKIFKKLVSDRKGINTVEVVVLVAIALGLALIFRERIIAFVNSIFANALNSDAFALPTITPSP